MATTTSTEDELLIISDDDISEKPEIEIEQEKQNNNSIIDFGDTEVSEEINNEPKKNENSIDLNFDLGSEDSDIKVSDIFSEENNIDPLLENKNENINLESDFSFDLGENETKIVEEKIPKEKTENNGSDIDFGIDLNENKETKNKLINEEKIPEEKTENNGSDIDFGIDLNKNKETKNKETKNKLINDEKEILKPISNNEKNEKETSLKIENNSTAGDNSTTGDDDINSILEATIAKLTIRKESIEKIKLETTNKIEELAKEIKELQSEVKTHKTEIKDFDKETGKIEENIESLEKMKMK